MFLLPQSASADRLEGVHDSVVLLLEKVGGCRHVVVD
jgi:hypothetical protein